MDDEYDGMGQQTAPPQHLHHDSGMEEGHLDPDVPAAARQRADHEDQWAPKRELLLQEYLMCLPENDLRAERLKAAVRSEAVAAIAEACAQCRHCGRADGLHQVRDAHVLYVHSSYTFELPVPICFCQHCSGETAAHPLEAGCFPSTPSHAWDVCSAPSCARPLWFDLEMLEVCEDVLSSRCTSLHACRPTASSHCGMLNHLLLSPAGAGLHGVRREARVHGPDE